MEEKTDRTATKVEEQVMLLTETVAQLTVMLDSTAQLVSALLYANKDMKIPVWKDSMEDFNEVKALAEKIIEVNKPDGQRETDKS